jgi:tripartite-type tricarboxylate transporter receptor subunit TctC
VCIAPAQAQEDYPSRPIRLLTPVAQGGTTDLLARIFSAKLGEIFGQQVLVENRASAAGVIGTQITATAPPDGYTLLLTYHQHTVNAALNPQLPYDPVESFTPITQLTAAGLLLVVNPPRRRTPCRSSSTGRSTTRARSTSARPASAAAAISPASSTS